MQYNTINCLSESPWGNECYRRFRRTSDNKQNWQTAHGA